jgi:hypothetical protein
VSSRAVDLYTAISPGRLADARPILTRSKKKTKETAPCALSLQSSRVVKRHPPASGEGPGLPCLSSEITRLNSRMKYPATSKATLWGIPLGELRAAIARG